MRRKTSFALLAAAAFPAICALSWRDGARAEGARPAPSASASAAPPPAWVEKLASSDPQTIKQGLDEVRLAGKDGAPAAPRIAELLEGGLPLELTLAAIETLGDTEAPAGSEALAWYTRHRVTAVRLAAVRALVHTKGPAAVAALRAALSDPDADVRQNAANGLGAIGAREAVDDLMLALDRRIPGVAATIGALCTDAQCDAFSAKIAQIPFDLAAAGVQPLVFRNDLADETKMRAIDAVRAIGQRDEVNAFLRELLRGWPQSGSKRVRSSLEQAVIATTKPGSAR